MGEGANETEEPDGRSLSERDLVDMKDGSHESRAGTNYTSRAGCHFLEVSCFDAASPP